MLGPFVEPVFYLDSFSSRQGRSAHDAIAVVSRSMIGLQSLISASFMIHWIMRC